MNVSLRGVMPRTKGASPGRPEGSVAECQSLIDATERKGYDEAQVNVGGGRQVTMKEFRNNDRVMFDDEIFAATLWKRIKDICPNEKILMEDAVGVNERLRFLRYDQGMEFKPHLYGVFSRRGEISRVTLQLYLNEGFKGGSTRFLGSVSEAGDFVDCVPKTGSVLLFEHRLLHQGSCLEEGRKYTMRTDILYSDNPSDDDF